MQPNEESPMESPSFDVSALQATAAVYSYLLGLVGRRRTRKGSPEDEIKVAAKSMLEAVLAALEQEVATRQSQP